MKSRNLLIVGNWKMNPTTVAKATTLFTAIDKSVSLAKNVKAVICPPFPYITALHGLKLKKIGLGAQNISENESGAFTGEVSAEMVRSSGAQYVILGHSEARARGETDELVNTKIKIALEKELKPIVCIGEKQRDEEGVYLSEIKYQIEKALSGITKSSLSSVIFAYEPIFAVGGTKALDARGVHEMTIFIKKTIVDFYKLKTAPEITILYGGAVDPLNTFSILNDGQADGLLIGRQSLDAKSFSEIIALAKRV